MYIEKCIEVEVDLNDFDFEDICEFVLDKAINPTAYEAHYLERIKDHFTKFNKDLIYQMERDEFEELFEIMKDSWQNLT